MDPKILKPDEKALLVAIAKKHGWIPHNPGGVGGVRSACNLAPIPKRAWYVAQKFSRWGWLDYGVSLGAAWLTPLGVNAAIVAAGKEPLDISHVPAGPDARRQAGLPVY